LLILSRNKFPGLYLRCVAFACLAFSSRAESTEQKTEETTLIGKIFVDLISVK